MCCNMKKMVKGNWVWFDIKIINDDFLEFQNIFDIRDSFVIQCLTILPPYWIAIFQLFLSNCPCLQSIFHQDVASCGNR